ncbi:MAG: HEPN domain-containing protein [Leptolyngbyaceae cyanobacterium]|uniref:HEPN domain-containing protein n=1 Tax=Leptodesmis TaxID=2664261 RepID=UPI001F459224|nr:HEPN domain-containing protein [Leptodesmis sichuanensis]UIE36276.1 HEPN domain-containing protein [Leptodesmis sichuanensis A121]
MTPEQQQLIDKASENVRAAQLLTNEGLQDVAVSRAYYAMFYIAEAFLLGDNLSFSKHSAVISKFGEYFARPGRVPVKFHRYLIQAEQSRIKADYDATSKATVTEATEQINRAVEFIALAEREL